MATEDKQSTSRRNVYFEAGLKEEGQKSSWAESRPRTPMRVYASDLDNESLWLTNSVTKTRSSESSTAVTPRSQGNNSPLPLGFIFKHLSGMKSSIGEALAMAHVSASTSPSPSGGPRQAMKGHSYTKLKRKKRKNSALKAMSYPAIVASFLLQHEDLAELTIPEDAEVDIFQLPPKKIPPVTLFGSRLRDPCRRYNFNKKRGRPGHMSWALKARDWRYGRRTMKCSGARYSALNRRRQKLLLKNRSARILKKWDVQTALGPLLQLGDQARLGDLKTPIVAESLNYCSDRTWRWRSCLLVGYDSSCGMYRALCDENIEDRCGSRKSSSQPGTSTPSSDICAGGSENEGKNSWEFNSASGCWEKTIKGDQQLPTRLVARLNLRLPADPRAQSTDNTFHDGTCPPSVAIPTHSARAESPSTNPSSNLNLSTKHNAEVLLLPGCAQGIARLGQELEFNPPSSCSAEGSLRQGHVVSEASAFNLRTAPRPLNGVESRLGVGLGSGASERSFSFRRLSVSGRSNPFTQPGEFHSGGSELSENLLSWRKKQRPDSARCIIYDVFPLLSELAKEFEHAASIVESTDITSLREAGMRGPRPVRVDGHPFIAHSSSLAASSALLRPGLQAAMLLVVDSVKLVEKTRFLATSAPCVSIAKAVVLQIDNIEESTDYIRKVVLADARDALNTALVRDEGLTNMKNGSKFYIRIARWANLLTEAALAKALEGTLDAYASRFCGGQTPLQKAEGHQHVTSPLFVVKLTVAGDNMDYRTPLSKLSVFPGKLLDDVLGALLSLPFMDTKDSGQSKVERDVLRRAADYALPLCRLRVSQAVADATEAMQCLHGKLSDVWTDLVFFKRSVDSKARDLIPICQQYLSAGRTTSIIDDNMLRGDSTQEPKDSKETVGTKFTLADQLEDFMSVVRITLRKQRELHATFTENHGKVVGTLFRLDSDEMLMHTSSMGANCKHTAAETLREVLQTTMKQLKQKLAADETVLATSLSDLSPENFAAVEAVVKDYEMDPHPLSNHLEILHACHSALENLSLELDNEDVSSYWSLYGRTHHIFTTVRGKEKFLKDGKSIVIAALRTEQAANFITATEVIGSIVSLESLKDVKEAFDNEFLVKRKRNSLNQLRLEIERLKKKEKLLNITENEECSLMIAPASLRVELLMFLWSTVADWIRNKDQWMQQRFQRLNVEHMFFMVQTFGEKLTKLVADTKCSSSQNVILSVADEVNDMLTKLPLLVRLRHPGVRRVHWIELASKTGCMAFLDAGEVLNLKSVLELPLFSSYQEIIWTVLERAAEEYNQEVCLEKMEAEMRGIVLELSPRNESDRQMIRGSEKILELLDDQLVAAGCMLRSPFAKALEGSVRAWRDKLNMLLHLLEELLSFQKWFQILRPIFSSSNIRQQLADESGRFAQLDHLWQQVLDTVVQRRLFLHVCESSLVFEEVPKRIKTMEGIMCSLITLLERKRSKFPRFYFLSNDELLQVLSHEQNPNELQYYLCKCFCGLHGIELSKEGIVTGLWVEKSEYLPFFDPVHTFSRPVEEWMVAVEQEMRETVMHAILERIKELHVMPNSDAVDKGLHVMTLSGSPTSSTRKFKYAPRPLEFKSGVSACRSTREEHSSFFNCICQVLVVAAYVTYCSEVEKILSAEEEDPVKGLLLLSTNLSEELEECVSAIKSSDLSHREGTYKSLILLFVYFRDIINRLQCGTQVGIGSFEWQRSVRYYCQPNGDCQVGIMNQEHVYGCDVIDSHNRLVMTSLTEKCFLGMLYSFSLGLGCNVTGSSGVGKTETIKDCAKALGKHCIVISCSEEFDHQAIGNVLKGMASGGLWLCLTKFERLRPEVVSILTQQLLTIQQAVATKALRFNYEGSGFQLNPRFAICTTTEPKFSGGYYGYLHKTRSSFRAVCMILPDCNTIVQILLTAEGISDSAGMAQKLTLCFRMASEQLSFEENHCDFGLRAMKAVVKWMSVLNSTHEEESAASTSALKGDIILCKTLQQYCLPRLVGDGYTLFSRILSDLFPDLQVPTLRKQRLEVSINSSLIERGLRPYQPLLEKCMQLHGAMKVHRGVMIVGASGSGKTQCYTTLSNAINLMFDEDTNLHRDQIQKRKSDKKGQSVSLAIVNPSAVSTSHLFGCANSKTQSWQEGIVPSILRDSEQRVKNGGSTWMVLDGDMDSIWLEHVSTMLDDNGILCLSNSKRILLPRIENFSMLFEVESLKSVSPGTVSRCGIILMNTEDQGWKPLVHSWVQHFSSLELKCCLQKLFDIFLGPCLEVALNRPDLPVVTAGLVSNLLSFLEAALKPAGHDYTLESRKELETADSQIDRWKPKCEVMGNKIRANSSLEKLGRVRQIINERQKQVRDAVNWRRLHHRKFISAYEGFQKDTGVDENNNKGGFSFKGMASFYEASEFSGESVGIAHNSDIPIVQGSLGCLFVFGLLWSLGGHLHSSNASEQLEKVVRDASILHTCEMGPFPDGSMYDYYYDMKFHTWKTWEQFLVQVHSVSESGSTFLPLSHQSSGSGKQLNFGLKHGILYVPTVETIRAEFLAQSMLKQRRPVLISGGMGSGKTVVSTQILHAFSATAKCQVVGVTLNSTSGGSTLYDVIRPKLAIWRRRCLMPAAHGKMVIFVDDLNISQLHVKPGAPALQFLRFLIEQKAWFGLPMDATFTAVEGLVHLAAMSKISSCVTSPLARLLRHFYIICSTDYCPTSLRSVFSAALIHHCQRLSRSSDVMDMVKTICQASIHLYFRLRMKLPSLVDQLPPILGLHDLFRVQRKLLLGCLRSLTSFQSLYRLWAYEFTRVYCDRLRNEAHRKLVISEIYATTQEVLKFSGDEHECYLNTLIDEENQPLFGVFYREEKQGSVQTWSLYEEVACRVKWEQAMSAFLASYTAEEGSQTPIVLFPGAVSHLSRLLNILRMTEGHVVLLGYCGSGRSSLARLATYALGYTLFEVQVNGSYNLETWTADLRNLLKTCSLRATPTVFLIILEPDATVQIQIMEDLNLIVHCGEAVELLGEEEKYYIQQELHRMEETSQLSAFESVLGSDREQYLNQCFANRVKENLRLVICTETPSNRETSSSSTFVSALINRHFSVDYYDKWTPVALQAVARVTLAKHEHVKKLSSSDLELITRACSMIHTTSNSIASSSPLKGSWRLVGMPSYHEMLYVFGRILARKGQEVDSLLKRLETGLQKLQSTRILVEDMQYNLQELLRRKEHTNSDMDQLLLSISNEQVQMDKALEEVAHDERVAVGEAETCKKLAQDAQNQVQEVAPEVLTAIKQLSQLNKKDISELKSFTQPPPRLLTVLEALCVILKKEPKHIKHPPTGMNIETVNSYWPVARELLSQVDFVKMLLSFNKDAMENSTMEKLKPYMDNPLFKPEKVRRISVACRSICIWIRAMYNYHYAKTVKMEPRIEKLKIANHNLETCKDTLEEARRRLSIAEDNLRNLRARYEDASRTKDGLAKKAEDSEVKLQRARRLIGRLDGECQRWSARVDDLQTKRKNVVGDAVLASGLVAYLGSFPASFRSRFLSEWHARLQNIGLDFSRDFSLVTFYTTPQDIKAWAAAGLPPDDHSLENGIIVYNTSRPMLILDPQKQVSRWICSIENPANIVMLDINSPHILQEAQSCTLTENLLIVENIGSQTPPGLIKKVTALVKAPSLTHITAHKVTATKRFFHCGCILLTYEQGFNYSEEVNVCVSLNVVDFSITFHGLCSQLLSIAAEKERLDLEEERNHLLHQRLLLNCRLQEIEDHILTLLQGVMVTILDDEILEEALSKATTTYADIQAKLVRAAVTEAAVEITRKRHLPVAERAAILYSCIADVSKLESVYQWTLPWFKNVYSTSMQRTTALNPVDFDTRLDYLISKITIAVYRKICCGLLKKHQVLFGLLVVFRLAQTRHDVEQEEWLFLLQGDTGSHSGCLEKGCPSWLNATSKEWRQLCALSSFPRFEGLIEDLERPCWREFFQTSQTCILPEPWPQRLGPFRSLLVLRCLRLDMVMGAINQLVQSQLRLKKEDLAELSVEDACDESNPETPVTCIFQGVATPLEEIMTCAKRKNMLKRLRVFSLDQCQGPKLLDAVKEAATWGKWVVLQNCHANVPWINNSLRVVLEEVKQKPVHESFRLWLTMMPTSGRPPYLLSDSVKIVVEPPCGVKSKILQILKTQQADEIYFGKRTMRIDGHVAKHPRALFQLGLFHALVQERASFGAIGWNIGMQLDHTVFNLAKAELIKLVEGSDIHMSGTSKKAEKKETSWEGNHMESLQHMITKVIYGGYVIDTWDEHSLNQLFKHCFKSNFDAKFGSSMRSYLPKNKGTIDDFLKHANELPEPDDPEVMGLQKDAVLSCAERDTQHLFAEALTLETGIESFLAPLSCIFETKKSLVLQCLSELRTIVSISLDESQPRADCQQTADPVSLLLLQEVKRYNRLLLVMRTSMAEAMKDIEIPGEMKPEMESFCGSIIAGQVPELWLKNAYASMKSLPSWIKDFRKRIEYMHSWIRNTYPRVIWISCFFFPQAFFAATLQRFARAKKIPLSTVHLDVIMTDNKTHEEREDGCYITGLHLEGARWDAETEALAEPEPKHLPSSICGLLLRPRTNESADRAEKFDTSKHYCCPIYTTPARNGLKPCRGCNYVGKIDIPVGTRSAMHWALQGVALLCSSRD